jgi:hypothetical protein
MFFNERGNGHIDNLDSMVSLDLAHELLTADERGLNKGI